MKLSWKQPKGWRGESYRHYLASKGVRSKVVQPMQFYARPFAVPQVRTLQTAKGEVFLVVPGNDPNYVALPGKEGEQISDAPDMAKTRFILRDGGGNELVKDEMVAYNGKRYVLRSVTARSGEPALVILESEGGSRIGVPPERVHVDRRVG